MKIKTAVGAGVIVVAAVLGIGVYQSPTSKPPTAATGPVVAEAPVADALAAKECTFLTKSGDVDAPHTVVLVSRTGAMAGLSLPDTVLTQLRTTAGGVGEPVGSLTLITVGGGDEQPRIVLNRAALTDPKAGTDRAARLAAKLPSCVSTALDATAGPQHAGSDELLAQQFAARAANGRLLIVSDGEANTGLLDLRNQNYPQGDPAAAVARVKTAGQLPNFTGLTVTYYGIGQNRTEAERTWLTTFYQDLCTEAHGSCIIAKDLVPVSESAPRHVPDDPPLQAVTAVAKGPATIYRLDAAAFAGNSADFVDQRAVTTALTLIVQTSAQTPTRAITVNGHACNDRSPESELQAISMQRAQKVADLLRKLGVTAAITAIGHSADEPLQGPEPNGAFTSAQCAANRRVDVAIE